jgi:hypothetical protein
LRGLHQPAERVEVSCLGANDQVVQPFHGCAILRQSLEKTHGHGKRDAMALKKKSSSVNLLHVLNEPRQHARGSSEGNGQE